ncbi:hypothetical protein HMPREF9630_02105 [Peptoanaerobacter stomatis]|uniref:Uncharacterized protein n=1 Tax=Peptoanaerobacter stomatis TaxID=796937 RepID=J6HEL5_9FIRM|nr:hypothetical protein [Peptoanaerobacter stomatis]EJU23480.1 hypothetical protein HMPREF1143_2046 [Peptoanaerobacter stomatis]EJZ44328.1 hypothetical protein HMPREF9630_02105 [Peptoanaerobacter stomatis]NWO24561.1 hypothetical protein [Peptostreptococcaceae bacterium oral taxon 081]
MKITPATRNTMSNMISNVRLNSNVNSLHSVKEVGMIDTSNNAMSSDASVLAKEYFYDKLSKKEKEPNKNAFSKEEKQNKKSLFTVSEKDRETLDFLNSMFIKFNSSMDNIKKIDIARGQNNFYKIKNVINENSRFLASIGIMTDKLSHFYVNEEVFVREIMTYPQKLNNLLEPQTGVIRKICDSFGNMLLQNN